jgi:SHS2 domain-containing protein
MKRYDLIEHTADIGIRAYGRSLQELFENAAFGLFEIIADLENVKPKERFEITLDEENREELFVAWLRELLYKFNTDQILFNNFVIRELTDTKLNAFAWGEKFDKKRHNIKDEVKAITYHGLKLEKSNSNWQVEVIFDV